MLIFKALYRDVEVDGPCAVDDGCELALELGDVGLAETKVWTAEITGKSENFAALRVRERETASLKGLFEAVAGGVVA